MNLMPRILSTSLLAGLLLLSTACGEKSKETNVGSLKIIQGENQLALPGEDFSKEIIIELYSPPGRSVFGGEAKPVPVAGKKVKVVPGPGLTITDQKLVSDNGGMISFKVKAGKSIGDKYLTIIPEGSEISQEIRFVIGAKLEGGNQEGIAGEKLAKPVSIRLVDQNGKPAVGVPVYFTITDSPERKNSASVGSAVVKTDEKGVASSEIKLGKSTGVYTIGVEVADPDNKYFIRTQKVKQLGIDRLSVVLTLIGGLAFFLFGMKLMGDGLLKIAGENMKKILQFFSKRTTVAVLAGAVVTAIIQSSSATTVMVIGFINAGLLTLRQSIGLIFGANIGTTVTGQLVAFDLAEVALPAVAVGFLVMLAKKRIIKGWGETILGFGLLFFGMNLMSSEMKLLGEFPSFVNLFRSFDCAPEPGGLMPVGAVLGTILIGALATFVIQSSSAAIGIIIALAAGGLINFYTAVPLLLGTNIGTTITAFLAALTANRVAKQAALAHMLFNVIGTLVMIVLFYIPYGPARQPCFLYFINWITPGNAFAAHPQNIERNIAMAHTFFNIFAVVLLTPFAGIFTKLCEMILPLREPVKIQRLEPHLLKTPSIAIEQVVNVLRSMVKDAWVMVDEAVNQHFMKGEIDTESTEKLDEQEEKIDDLQAELTNYLVRITRRPLTHHQSAIIPLLMHCTNDAERIADHTDNILKLTKRLHKTGRKLSDVAIQDLNKLWSVLDAQANSVMLALASSSDKGNVHDALESEKKVNKLAKKYEKNYTRKKDLSELMADIDEEELELPVPAEDDAEIEVPSEALENKREINQLARQYENDHVKRRDAGKCAVETNVIFVEMLWELEKLGDHLANIAMRTPKIQEHYVEME
ncbi:MAG: Na/Pi symporter [Lentisphaeria bacterium]|nr:Na/Pi symporter [Lentisphaeria bacterium]